MRCGCAPAWIRLPSGQTLVGRDGPPDTLVVVPHRTDAAEKYQKRRREFQPLWNRNFLLVALPGFVLFLLANPVLLDLEPLVFVGFPLFAFGLLRGFLLMRRYLRCPTCNRVQNFGRYYPNRQCLGCGADLSYGPGDS